MAERMIWKSSVRKWSLCKWHFLSFFSARRAYPPSLEKFVPATVCAVYIYLICIIMETNDVGYLNRTILHAKRGTLRCKCSWCRLNSFPFNHSEGEEIMWNVFNYVRALSWFKITQGCVSYIFILANSLILFFPCDQLINWASQLIVQIVPLILWLCAWPSRTFLLCVSVCTKPFKASEVNIDETVYSFTHLDCAYWDKTFVLNSQLGLSCDLCCCHLAADYASGALLCDNS